MKMMNKQWRNLWACLALGLSVAACSGDAVDSNADDNAMTNNQTSGTMCEPGESYNPILGRCARDTSGNNNTPKDMGGDRPDMPSTPPDMSITPDDGGDNPDQGMVTQDMGADMPGGSDMPAGMDMPADMTVTPPDMGDGCGYGTILGVACVPSGDALPNAQVTVTGIDCHTGLPFTKMTTASATGRYELTDVPSGMVEVTLESGSFNRTFPVSLDDGEMLDLTQAASKVCIEGNSVKIAVIAGEYDDVEGILDDLQFSYDVKGNDGKGIIPGIPPLIPNSVEDEAGLQQTRDFFMDPTAMAQYDVIFINCGNLWDALNSIHSGDVNTIITNLFNFYGAGNSIYASDWAHMFVERAFPSVLDFFPAGGTDGTANDARQGYAPQNVTASVDSAGLQGVLGSNSVLIDFPHNPPQVYNDHWVMMAGADPNATIHLSGNVQQCADQACQSPGSTLAGAPLLVTFKSPSHGGSIGFTSFHNHAEGTPVSPEISAILKFLIVQL